MARRLGVLAVIVVGLATVMWAGLHNLRARRLAMQAAQPKVITLSRDNEASPDAQGANLRGKPAPGFKLVDTTGKPVALADFKGKPVIVNFWATWCAPCKLEMPWFEEFSGKYKAEGLTILGLSQDDGASREDISAAARRLGVKYPILMPDDAVAKQYGGVDYLPETFYVARDGTVTAATAGAPSKDEMEANIRKIVGGA